MLILDGGYDLPEGPHLPPMDLVEDELRKLGVRVSRLAVALGMEADLQICGSLVPRARSKVEIRREVAGLLLVACATAVQLGIDPEMLLADVMRDPGLAMEVLQVGPWATPVNAGFRSSARGPGEVGGPSTAPMPPCSAQDDRSFVGAGAMGGSPIL